MARPALAATRATEIINFLAARPREAFTLSDLVERLNVNVASTHAILKVLSDVGFLTRHPRHRTYTLGPSLIAIGTVALEQHPAIAMACDEASPLSSRLELDVLITTPVGDEIVYVARSGPHRPRGMPTHVGQRMPLRPPLGSVFLAWSSDDEVEAWLARAIGEPTQEMLDTYRQSLEDVRGRGYFVGLETPSGSGEGRSASEIAKDPSTDKQIAELEILVRQMARTPSYPAHDLDPLTRYDVMSISAPAFDERGSVILAVNLVGLPAAVTGEEVRAYGEAVRDAAMVVTKRTHGRLPE
jgi:DNA-binding IclR family transcriptional regulator